MLLRGIHVLRPCVNLHLDELDNLQDINDFKASKSGIKKEKYESKLLCSLFHHWLSFGLNKKVSFGELLRRRDRVLRNIYISMIVQRSTVQFHI